MAVRRDLLSPVLVHCIHGNDAGFTVGIGTAKPHDLRGFS